MDRSVLLHLSMGSGTCIFTKPRKLSAEFECIVNIADLLYSRHRKVKCNLYHRLRFVLCKRSIPSSSRLQVTSEDLLCPPPAE